MARKTSRRRSPHWLAALAVGVLLGAGLGVALTWHRRPPQAPPATPGALAPRHPAPASRPPAPPAVRGPAPTAPAPSVTPPSAPGPAVHAPPSAVPAQNPEASQGPAIGPALQTPLPPGTHHPRVAIIFDDAGYSLRAAQEIMALDRPVTISVLPGLAYSTAIAEEAPAHGVQVILHLPVEPDNPSIPLGPGGVTTGMGDEEIRRTVDADLATVPNAIGANNHMGSRGTADPRVMHAVLEVMKARHLFFVDSLTSPRSVAAQVAREMGVPTAVRAVFLDNEDDDAYVRGQLRLLIKLAESRGQAIAIGHVGKVTAAVLRDMLPEFNEAGIQFVPVSQLVR